MNDVPSLSVSSTRVDGVAVLRVSGDVDLTSEKVLRAAIDDALSTAPAGMVLDLTAVEFLGSIGLTIMVEARGQVGAAFAVVSAGPATTKPIEVTKIDELVAVHPTLDEALAALSAP